MGHPALKLRSGVLLVPPGLEETGALPTLPLGLTVRSDSPSTTLRDRLTSPYTLGMAGAVVIGVGVVALFFATIFGGVLGWSLAEPVPVAEPAAAAVSVVIASIPAGAELRVDGLPVGVTPYVLEVEEGKQRAVDVKLGGYKRELVMVDGTVGLVQLPLRKKTSPDKFGRLEDAHEDADEDADEDPVEP